MKRGSFFIVGFVGCFVLATATSALAERHVMANHHEIFIDKVQPVQSSHAYRGLKIFLKTTNSHLDGAITEVGFHNKKVGYSSNSSIKPTVAWHDSPAQRFAGVANNYFEMVLPIASDFGQQTHTGAFYVKTDKGTRYWFNPNLKSGKNFVFDRHAFNNAMYNLGRPTAYGDYADAIPTQGHFNGYYNPRNSR